MSSLGSFFYWKEDFQLADRSALAATPLRMRNTAMGLPIGLPQSCLWGPPGAENTRFKRRLSALAGLWQEWFIGWVGSE
jgi:hypothetical protein